MKVDPVMLREALRLHAEGWSYPNIREATGLARTTVIKHARRAGHAHRRSGMPSLFDAETQALACRLYAENVRVPAISARTGASGDMVRRWARAAGLTMRSSGWRVPKR